MPTATALQDGTREVLLEGDLTIEKAQAIRELLLSALAQGGPIRLRIGRVGAIDLSSLQLICAFHRSAAGGGHSVVLDDSASPEFRAFVLRAGFGRQQGYCFSTAGDCHWSTPEAGVTDSKIHTGPPLGAP